MSVDKNIARAIGLQEAVVLGELCSIADMFHYEEFYFSQEKLCYDTALSEKQLRKSISVLESLGFVTVTKRGQPCRNWYLLNEEAIANYLLNLDEQENSGTSSEETAGLDTPKVPNQSGKNGGTRTAKREALLSNKNTYNNTNNNTINNNTNNMSSEKSELENKNSGLSSAPVLNKSHENYSRVIFDKFKDAGLPCADGDFFKFQCRDFRLALPKLSGFTSQEVTAAVTNYISELKNPQSWVRQEYSFDAFVGSNTFSRCLPSNYRPQNFRLFSNPQTDRKQSFQEELDEKIDLSYLANRQLGGGQ